MVGRPDHGQSRQHQERIESASTNPFERGIELVRPVHADRLDGDSECLGCRLDNAKQRGHRDVVRVPQDDHARHCRNRLLQYLELLCGDGLTCRAAGRASLEHCDRTERRSLCDEHAPTAEPPEALSAGAIAHGAQFSLFRQASPNAWSVEPLFRLQGWLRPYAVFFSSCRGLRSTLRMVWSFAEIVNGITPGMSHSVHILSTSCWKCSTSSSMKCANRPWRLRYS